MLETQGWREVGNILGGLGMGTPAADQLLLPSGGGHVRAVLQAGVILLRGVSGPLPLEVAVVRVIGVVRVLLLPWLIHEIIWIYAYRDGISLNSGGNALECTHMCAYFIIIQINNPRNPLHLKYSL